ncbi:MAG: hypothetical protein AAB465_00835 [Patescibacteria group bacterium]
MKFELPGQFKPNPKNERIDTNSPEHKRDFEKMTSFTRQIYEDLKKENIPVESDCRIDMNAFVEDYNSREMVRKDREEVRYCEDMFYGQLGWREREKRKKNTWGEKLEVLKTAVFHKFLRGEFVVARSSRYDDIKNGIDNVIMDKTNGNVICALDEVDVISGDVFQKKERKILEKDLRGGATLKYGLSVKEDKESQKLSINKTTIKNIPTFYLALPVDYIDHGMKEFIPDLDESSQYEKDLFKFFVGLIKNQIQALKLDPQLPPELGKRIEQFQESLSRINIKTEEKKY